MLSHLFIPQDVNSFKSFIRENSFSRDSSLYNMTKCEINSFAFIIKKILILLNPLTFEEGKKTQILKEEKNGENL